MKNIKNLFSKIKDIFKSQGQKKPLDIETIKKVLGYILERFQDAEKEFPDEFKIIFK